MEPHLCKSLESFFRQDYPHYEIIFGVRDAADPALSVVRELSARYPDITVKIALSGEPRWPNAKVYNLQKMVESASHSLLVISDSDVHVTPEYLREVTRPLLDPSVGMVTCLYRGVHTGGLWSRLEALGMSVEMTSGVLVADMMEGMKFALGPTMATRRDCLEAAGGFTGLSDYLADDYVLGNRIHAAGYKVVLSEHVIEHLVVNQSMFSSLQHQVRWAKSTRRSRPKGHIGTGLTFAVPFALLGLATAAVSGSRGLGLTIFAAGMLNRAVQCLVVGWGVVRDPEGRRSFWLYPFRDLLGFIFWAASFVTSSRTTWRGDRYRLQPGGRMVREPKVTAAT
jgi:ceramide glucosyltransferase